jgi:hypothetical protein
MTSLHSEAWLKKIDEAVRETLDVPLWGASPPFPWEEASRLIGEAWNTEELHLSFHTAQWLSDPLSGMGHAPLHLLKA